MKIDERTLTSWGESMYELADRMDLEFEGWGDLIENVILCDKLFRNP